MPSTLDFTDEQIEIGDKMALVDKINAMQAKLQAYSAELNVLTTEIEQLRDQAAQSADSANTSVGAAQTAASQAQAAAAGEVISDTETHALKTWSSVKLNAEFPNRGEVDAALEANKETTASLMAKGAI